jgi:hydrogenase maturation protease
VKILVAGIGNIFHGDDAFGVEVVRRLRQRSMPKEADVVDFGIRGFDLAYALLDGYDVTLLIDATSRGEAPGTLYTIEIDPNAPTGLDAPLIDVATHGMNPMRVLQMAKAMGGVTGRFLLIGCEPETLGSEEEGQMGLSATVEGVVDSAADMVEARVRIMLQEARTPMSEMERRQQQWQHLH